jgi:hypothetical protein
MVAATTPLVTGHNPFVNKAKVKFGDKVRVEDTKSITVQAADNNQHCAFGSGSSLTRNIPHSCTLVAARL